MVRNCQLSDLIYLTALRGPVSLCVRVCGAGSGVVLEGSSAPFSLLFLRPTFTRFPAGILMVLLGLLAPQGNKMSLGIFLPFFFFPPPPPPPPPPSPSLPPPSLLPHPCTITSFRV